MTYSSLTPVLVKAIQDEQAIIEELRRRIESLERDRQKKATANIGGPRSTSA